MGAASKRRRSNRARSFFQRARSVRYRLYRRSQRGRRRKEGSPRPPRRKSLGSSKQTETLKQGALLFSARAGGSLSFVQAFPARPQMQGRFPQTPSKEITWEQQANGDARAGALLFFSAGRRFAIVRTGVPCSLRGAQCMGRRFIFRALRGKSKKRIKHEKAAGLPRRLSLSLWLYLTIVSPASLPNTTVSTTAWPPRRFAPWMPPVTSPAATRPGITSPLVSSTRHSVSIFTPPIV